ncbi:MAG: response regulator, partial [Bacillota bacterium]
QLVKKESNNQIIFDTAKLLVVDDIASNRDLITAILQETNLQVITAADGQQAVQMAQKEEFDLILMDLKLPVLDGYQARKEIKKTKLNHNTAVLAVTASATIAEIEQVKQANFADFITKPLERDNLIAILAEHLEHQVENNSTVDVVEIDLNLEEIELAELVMELEEKFIPWYRELKEVFIINEVEDFATELVVVGQKYKFDFLVNYAEKLKEYAIEFQINETRQQFNKFTDIIEKLNNKLSKN